MPAFDRVHREVIIERGIQFDAVELCRVISQFVLGSFGIEAFEVSLIPFGASYVNLRLSRFTGAAEKFLV
ncbi:hypothetical protein D3C86_2054210 [compost metagenome]